MHSVNNILYIQYVVYFLSGKHICDAKVNNLLMAKTSCKLFTDKGNCVVVMDKHQYREKDLSLLNDRNTYSIPKSDPTSKTQRKLNKMLLDLKKACIINEDLYRILYSSDGLSPRFYGLPKILA